jgi:methyl-accepting chemotaxis protein
MQKSLQEFSEALAEMRREHILGAVEHRIDPKRFPGIYAVMAQDVIDLVMSHIVSIRRGREIIEHYGRGDFSIEHEAMPGIKIRQAVAINKVKSSFESISTEVMRLADAAARGDFTARGDVDKYENDFRKMVEGLNRLMEVSDRGLAEITRVLGAIAQGDLTQKMEGDYAGSFARLKEDTNRTVRQLTTMVGEFHETTQTITAASNEIAAGNTDLSSRTEQQAASLQETASSMAALTVTVMRNADNAEQANQLAIGASKVALKGGEAVSEVVKTMSSIDRSSKKIGDIIAVIDGIAFQTNILALNAAVEAARAGEQGRGFAVVASEVRSLAQRSAAAAKEIKVLIEDSLGEVKAGASLVDVAGATMEEILTSVKQVTDIMADITAAAAEQSVGIEQVNRAIVQMDQSTEQNAALVEQATAAAESMQEQAQGLAEAVGVFKLGERGYVAQRDSGRAANRHGNKRANAPV